MTVDLSHRAALLDIYRELHDQQFQAITESERADLENQAQRIKAETFTIAFIGRFSVGKSLLINRLFLGEDILTVALKPTTARILLIRYGDRPALWLIHPDAEGSPRKEALVAPGETVATIAEAIRHHTSHLGAPGREETGYFQLDWPDGLFFPDGVQILDTVGTEDIDDRFIDQTYAAIRQSDAVVMVLNMAQPLAASEQQFIERHLRGTGKKVFLVVSKADSRSVDDQTVVLDDLRDRFGSLYREGEIRSEERIFAVSAKTGQGLEELRERLVRFVTQERLGEILHVHGEGLRGRLAAWSSRCRQTLNDYGTKKAGHDDRLRLAESKLEALADRLEHERDRLDDLRHDLEEELQVQVSDLKDACRKELRSLDLQGGSIQVISTELAMAFTAGITRLTNRLQNQARKELQHRIGKLSNAREFNLEQLGKAGPTVIDDAITYGGQAVGTGSVLAGVTSVGLALQAALATPIPWWGIGGTTTTTLFAGALAPWAIPAILVGVGLFWGSGKYRVTRQRQQREAFIKSARDGLDQDCSNLEQHISEQLSSYITTAWEQAEERVALEREALNRLIAETDLSALETRITTLRDAEQRLNCIARRLDALLALVV